MTFYYYFMKKMIYVVKFWEKIEIFFAPCPFFVLVL
ncbi:MAG TPA: hypothetical protein DHV15_09965 [Treponema sp.]|uniref:Uncharacterized protein n=1 Tax=Treponema denticola (strain ATCC 35405 / DSM 14222 / CIP 103919 / JCM 8153 / KCTC 15104) TaxID=243275 RepID=Q73L71_TREDE|nr:hypothetical protein TDE_1994 [Treponema denticola ATCC 35405]HCY95815.1 hypothetical protein [Treponema sp.]